MPTEPLSYERDIAPLQQKFFRSVVGNPRIRPEVAGNMSLQFSAGLGEQLAQQQKRAEFEDVRRSRQLQYDTALFSLDREREKAARERNMLTSLAPLQAELDNVLSDPNTDYYAKQRSLGQIGVKHAPLFAVNQAADTAFRAAQTGLVREPKPDLTAASYATSGGHYGYLKDYEKKIGRPLQPEDQLPLSVFAEGLEATRTGVGISAAKMRSIAAADELRQRKADSLIGLVTKAKPAEPDKLTGKSNPNALDSPMSLAAVDGLIATYGTPAERRAAAAQNAAQRMELAQKMSTELLTGARAEGVPAGGETNFDALWFGAPLL